MAYEQLHATTWGIPPNDEPEGATCDECGAALGNMAWSVHGRYLCDDCHRTVCRDEVGEMSETELQFAFGYGRVFV